MLKAIYLLSVAIMVTSIAFAENSDNYKTLLKEKTDLFQEESESRSVIARDRAAYEKLRKSHPKLPSADTINFKRYAVIAAYVELPTPCHGLDFRKTSGRVAVMVTGPPPDTMCTQVIAPTVVIKLIPARPSEKLIVVFPK